MKGRRWDKASTKNVADPTPVYPYPNAYDLQVNVDHVNRTLYIGPSGKLKDPQGLFDRANITTFPTSTPRTVLGWRGFTRVFFKFPSKGPKAFQVDYLDAAGDLLGSKTINFTIL